MKISIQILNPNFNCVYVKKDDFDHNGHSIWFHNERKMKISILLMHWVEQVMRKENKTK
jgi:hypothetical protein